MSQFESLSLPQLWQRSSERYANKPAMQFLGRKFTYQQFEARIAKAAAGLQAQGVKKGTRVMLLLPNCPWYPIMFQAILRCGGIVVNANPLYAHDELKHLLEDSAAEMAVTLNLKALHDKLCDLAPHVKTLKTVIVCPFADDLPLLKRIGFTLARRSECAAQPAANDGLKICARKLCQTSARAFTPVNIDAENDVALLQYTGGTTGVPKAASLTHSNLTINAQQCAAWLPDAKDGAERMLAVLPFFHVFAMTAILNLSILKGFEIIAVPRLDMKTLPKLITETKPTLFPAVPTLYATLASMKEERVDLSSINFCISGGAPLPEDVRLRFEERSGCKLVEGYGLSETSPVVACNPLDGENKTGSIGLPLPETEVKFLSLTAPKRFVKQGKKGEIVVKGPQVMQGYWNRDDETKKTFWRGWLRTGDVGYQDEDGYIFIVDRLKDMIITNGYNVYPRHVEEAIYQHPLVEECIVAGVPDKTRGEAIKAWVYLTDGQDLTLSDLKTFLDGKLTPIAFPRKLEVRKEPLPRTLIGKLSRKDVMAEG